MPFGNFGGLGVQPQTKKSFGKLAVGEIVISIGISITVRD